MTALRLGLVGFGRLARDYYLPAVARLPDARLVAIADPLGPSRQAASARCPAAQRYESLPDMLDGVTLDAMLVASPPSSHLDAWRRAHVAGLPVFVEKPLLLASQLSLLDEHDLGARVMVDFNRRFWPPYARARAAITSGALGAPVALDFQLHLDVLGWSTVTDHRLTPDEGGLVHDLGCHAIDFASWVLGETPHQIAAITATERWPEDHLRLTLGFPSGATAHADLAYAERTMERVSAQGPAGRLWQDEPNMALHVRRAGARTSHVASRMLDVAALAYRGIRRARSVGRASVYGALRTFVETVRTGEDFAPGIADGLWNARCVAAAMRSAAAAGAPVRL